MTRALRLRLAPGRGDPFSASAGGELPSLSLSSSAAGGLRLRSGAVLRGTGGLGASGFGVSPFCSTQIAHHNDIPTFHSMHSVVNSTAGSLHLRGAAQQREALA